MVVEVVDPAPGVMVMAEAVTGLLLVKQQGPLTRVAVAVLVVLMVLEVLAVLALSSFLIHPAMPLPQPQLEHQQYLL